MNFRTTAILFGLVLAGGLALLGYTLFTGDDTPTDALLDELVGKGIKQDQIDAVEIERTAGGKLKIQKVGKDKDAKWEIVAPFHARADKAAVESVVRQLLAAKPTAYGDLTNNPAVHGLEPPSLRVTLSAGDRSATLNLGDVSIGTTKAVAFVTTSARKRPMAVPRSDIDALFRDAHSRGGGKAGDMAKWVSDYRVKSVFPAEVRVTAVEEVQSVRITKGKTLALARTPSGGWQFEEPKGWGDAATDGDTANPTAFTGVRPLLNALLGLQAATPDDFIENPGDLKQYGLGDGDPDRIQVELTMKDTKEPIVALIGKKADAAPPKDAKFPVPPATGKVFVQVKGEQGVIRASGTSLDGLAALVADPTPLRERTLLALDKTRVDAVDVTVGGQTVRLRKRGGQFGHWELFGGAGDPQKANEAAVNALLDVLTEKRTIKDFPAGNDANFTGPELKAEVKLWADGVEMTPPDPKADPKAEPKVKGNPYTVLLGKREGDSVYVRRVLPGGAKADFTLPENVVVKTAGGVPGDGKPTPVIGTVQKTRLDFLDPELKSFSEFNANRLTITKGGQTTEVTREEKPAGSAAGPPAWKYTQPDAMKGKDADPSEVSILLTLLSSQRAARFIDEQPADAKLAEYGLDPKGPALRVSVGLKAEGDDKERVYDLGKETTDGHVYARQQGRAAVFTLPKEVVNRFAGADLRDKTVVRFDQSKVKTVRLRGWFSLTGTVTVLEFEKQGGDWVAKSPPTQAGFAVDPTKVNMFLRQLDGLRAKAFVPGPQKAEYGLPPEQQGLEVTLLIEGHPGIALNIGGPADGGSSYYGWTNDPSAGGSVFTVNADTFKAYKEKPAAFAK